MRRHLKIDSVLHVCDVSCIKYCVSLELASKAACYHVCASDV